MSAAPSAIEAAERRSGISRVEAHGIQTEFPFELPRGYIDAAGVVHRKGAMRLATARDELVPLADDRVRENRGYLPVVLLARVITRIGPITDVHAGIIESLFASDLVFLQNFYDGVNRECHSTAEVTCPSCRADFVFDVKSVLAEAS